VTRIWRDMSEPMGEKPPFYPSGINSG